MTEIGASSWATLVAALLSLGVGGTLGGLLATWRTRRHGEPDTEHPDLASTLPPVKPLAGPEDLTEPVHLPPVTPAPLVSSTDLSTEDTVQLRLPPDR
jgi:hypothetical protein